MEPHNFGSNEGRMRCLESNPLQVHTVIKSIMGFLPFKEVLKFRLVDHNWESTSHSVIRNRGKFALSANFRPSDFLQYSVRYNWPLPITSFKFAQDGLSENWASSELQEFLIRYGKETQNLEFEFPSNYTKASEILNDWIRWRPFVPFLVELKVTVDHGNPIILVLASVSSLKSLVLSNCVLNLDGMENKKMSPRKISLRDMQYTQDGLALQYVRLNDFFNFRGCSEMEFVNLIFDLIVVYDISKDNIRANKINLESIEVINWQFSYAETEQLILTRCPLEIPNQVQVKELNYTGSILNLSCLPITIEKLSISLDNNIQFGVLMGGVDLPNLKSLRANNQIIHEFADCGSIVNVELIMDDEIDNGPFYALHKNAFPKKMSRLKISPTQEIVGTEAINIDNLIIEKCTTPCAVARRLMRNITPKRLVISLHETIISEQTDDIFEFISKNETLEEIVVLFPRGLKEANLFWKETVNYYRESYLVFRGKKLGVSLTKEQFNGYFNIY